MDWRVLVIDDEAAEDVKDVIQGNKVVSLPDSITCTLCEKFTDAVDLLRNERFDLVILDLKDAAIADDQSLAGEVVFEEVPIFTCNFSYGISK
jgi:response regulator of citrate/malate metabolism